MLQSENGMENYTEPLSDGAPYQEMELISNVHVIRFFTTNGNYERVSLDDAINMYSVEISLTKDSPSNPMVCLFPKFVCVFVCVCASILYFLLIKTDSIVFLFAKQNGNNFKVILDLLISISFLEFLIALK